MERVQSAKPHSARRSIRTSHAASRVAAQAIDPAAAAAQAPYARNESGTCSGYQIVRISGGGNARSSFEASAAAMAATPQASSGSRYRRAAYQATSATSATPSAAVENASALLVSG